MWFGLLDDQTFRWAPDRAHAWNEAKSAHASVVRTVVRWDQIAPARPAHRLNPFDPAYNFKDLDDFVISAQQRGIEVLLTLWGTPAWANGGDGPSVPWLMLRNHPGTPWQSGITGTPTLNVFARDAGRFDPRNPLVRFAGERRSFLFQLPALELRTSARRPGIATRCR
jgi:hypothetical protein